MIKVHFKMRDEKEGRKKQARSNKQHVHCTLIVRDQDFRSENQHKYSKKTTVFLFSVNSAKRYLRYSTGL